MSFVPFSANSSCENDEALDLEEESAVAINNEDNEEEETNFIVIESKKLYTKKQFVKSLKLGRRLTLTSGRPNLFYEVRFFEWQSTNLPDFALLSKNFFIIICGSLERKHEHVMFNKHLVSKGQ